MTFSVEPSSNSSHRPRAHLSPYRVCRGLRAVMTWRQAVSSLKATSGISPQLLPNLGPSSSACTCQNVSYFDLFILILIKSIV